MYTASEGSNYHWTCTQLNNWWQLQGRALNRGARVHPIKSTACINFALYSKVQLRKSYLVYFIGTALVLLNKHFDYSQVTILYCHQQRSVPILHVVSKFNSEIQCIQYSLIPLNHKQWLRPLAYFVSQFLDHQTLLLKWKLLGMLSWYYRIVSLASRAHQQFTW